MSHWITLVSAHGPMNGWCAEPDDKPVGGIVLAHEIFGVNADMRGLAERYAAEGYLTVVPALFDQIEREVELDDYTPDDYLHGNELASKLGVGAAADLIATAADVIGHAGEIAIVGYGWGGAVALAAARTLSRPCVMYYSTPRSALPQNEPVPVLVHYGKLDPQYPYWRAVLPDNGTASVQVRIYQAGDGFDRKGDCLHYHEESASQAFGHTVDFLGRHLRTQDN
ncbi:dienelactone hydrolase family protein [Burkholderia territorii]|uniref:dienelactone hydrolase family protein n=1 Tax=Burkholderia territorii TaxID=1503055 RepID=UPI0007580E8B|nr:dienelactone hydrolase family protein [Burkholderia territorii]KVQ61116.1 dienelactone hydrolase [Burkholderia territorii]KWA30898.1 dienelactone hydrolase [Burkholderia territorii]